MRASHTQPGFLAALLHRLAGIALAIFLPIHFLALASALNGADALDSFLRATSHPALKLAEGVIVVALALHMALGLRVLAIEFLPVREHTRLAVSLCLAAALAVGLAFLLNVVGAFASLPLAKLIALWAGAFLGGLASGASGFAFGIVATSIWLHWIEPLYATFLVVSGGLTIQIGTTWPLRHAIERRRIMPFLIAGLIGIPIGVWLLVYTNPRHLRIALGIFLAIYGTYALTAPQLPHFVRGGRIADAVIGFFGGILGGVGGYSGTLPAIWTQLRGWPKDIARAVYQPFIIMAHVVTLLLIGAVALDRFGLLLYVMAVPALLLGAWVGWIIYGRLNEQRFRQAFAALLLVSGVILMF